MKIDDSIVKAYLNDETHYNQHWIFSKITEDGNHMFSEPNQSDHEKVRALHQEVIMQLNDFTPFNENLFTALFPNWKEQIKNVNIILSVGCPSPYDAMVRTYKGTQYMIFDLIQFLKYDIDSFDLVSIVIGMITHEFAHVCLQAQYSLSSSRYKQVLEHMAFDEGFAHLLAFKKDIYAVDFSKMIDAHYRVSIEKLRMAAIEVDVDKQKILLEAANTGAYWDKFASISGKLYLASHVDQLLELYQAGPVGFLDSLLETYR